MRAVQWGCLTVLGLGLVACSPNSVAPADAEPDTPPAVGDVIPATRVFQGGVIYTGLESPRTVEAVGIRHLCCQMMKNKATNARFNPVISNKL